MSGGIPVLKSTKGESSILSFVASFVSSVKGDRNNGFNLNTDKILRAIRVTVGALILLTIITAILIPQVLPVSGNSFINAKLEWIRTPIDGDLSFSDLKIGDYIPEGRVLGTITNERIDDYFLNQLKMERSAIESALFSLDSRKGLLEKRSNVLQSKVRESLLNIEEVTKARLSMVKGDLARTMEEKAGTRELVRRYKKANRDYKGEESFAVVSRDKLEHLLRTEKELQAKIGRQKTDYILLSSSLESVLAGNYVSENTPVEQQQLLDTKKQLTNIASEIEVLTLKKNKLSTQVSARVELLNRNNHFDLLAGVSGTVWDIGFPDGSYVNHGDSIVAIADTGTLSVEGSFHQRYLDNIEVGDPVTIDLLGSSEKLNGTASELKIRDQIKSADLSAINVDSPAANEFNVVVAINEQHSSELHIGQRAKLIISKSSSSLIPSILLFFD